MVDIMEPKVLIPVGATATVVGGAASWYGQWLYYHGAAEGNVGKSFVGSMLTGAGSLILAGGILGLITGLAIKYSK